MVDENLSGGSVPMNSRYQLGPLRGAVLGAVAFLRQDGIAVDIKQHRGEAQRGKDRPIAEACRQGFAVGFDLIEQLGKSLPAVPKELETKTFGRCQTRYVARIA